SHHTEVLNPAVALLVDEPLHGADTPVAASDHPGCRATESDPVADRGHQFTAPGAIGKAGENQGIHLPAKGEVLDLGMDVEQGLGPRQPVEPRRQFGGGPRVPQVQFHPESLEVRQLHVHPSPASPGGCACTPPRIVSARRERVQEAQIRRSSPNSSTNTPSPPASPAANSTDPHAQWLSGSSSSAKGSWSSGTVASTAGIASHRLGSNERVSISAIASCAVCGAAATAAAADAPAHGTSNSRTASAE